MFAFVHVCVVVVVVVVYAAAEGVVFGEVVAVENVTVVMYWLEVCGVVGGDKIADVHTAYTAAAAEYCCCLLPGW